MRDRITPECEDEDHAACPRLVIIDAPPESGTAPCQCPCHAAAAVLRAADAMLARGTLVFARDDNGRTVYPAIAFVCSIDLRDDLASALSDVMKEADE